MPSKWFRSEGRGIYSLRSTGLEVKLIIFFLVDIASILLSLALMAARRLVNS